MTTGGNGPEAPGDHTAMAAAIAAAETGALFFSGDNPWVGCLIEPGGFVGATHPVGGPHAEKAALAAAGSAARGATVYTTLEPCSFAGRTGACTASLIDAGVARVVVGQLDPDLRNAGRGIAALEAAGIAVTLGVGADDVAEQLRPYLHFRKTGRPFVVLKLAATLDGQTAAPDGTSQWITSEEARTDAHRLRAESRAIVVGAGTVRADDPSLTVRHVVGPDPRRIVLGTAPAGARVHPCLEWSGELADLLDHLGADGVIQVLVEGGATVAQAFHAAGLVDRYVIYLAPALFGGSDGTPLLSGRGAQTIDDLWRGTITDVDRIGPDLRVVVEPKRLAAAPSQTEPELRTERST